MRLLVVSAVMGAGGAEVVADALVRDAVVHGHDVVLASGGGFRAAALVDDGVPHVRLPLRGGRPLDLLRAVVLLRRTCARHRPDVVHAHNVKAAVVARLGAGRRVPVLVTVHGVPSEQVRTAARLLRRVATHVVAVSGHVAALLREHGLPAARVTVVENAVTAVTAVARPAARALLGLDGNRPVVLVLARLAAQKRHDLLLEAWPGVGQDALLLVAGDGPRRDALHAQARAGGARDRIRFLGERTDVDVLLGAADLLVLPTDWEGLPISLVEALGAGVPAVVSDVGGVQDLAAGLHLVPPGSADRLGRAVDDLLRDPAARAALARRGREVVAPLLDADRMHRPYARLLRSLVRPTTLPTTTPGGTP